MGLTLSLMLKFLWAKKTLVLITSLALAGASISFFAATPASAVTGADFNPENIISDSVFFNGQAMTAAEIQSFLNQRVPHCLINDSTPQGHPAGEPYFGTSVASSCLKDYHMDTTSIGAQPGLCAAFTGGANKSAADIIFEVGRACNVSQKALLVILQKEQYLVSDDWPTVRQFDFATGFNCYDNGQPCVSGSAGFFKQVWSAARRLQEYGTGSTNWYPVGQVSQIQFQDPRVDTAGACGRASITIRNRATAALYYYTPYVPNAAALADLNGTGDRCSAFGNRNFWRDYWRWFGDPLGQEASVVRAIYSDILGRGTDPTGLSDWSSALSRGVGVVQVSDSILNSTEYRLNRIEAAYNSALGRGSDPKGRADWLNAVATGQIRIDEVELVFIESEEYFNRLGGTNAAYITAAYQRLLNRVALQPEIQFWDAQIKTKGRSAVTRAIFQSYESGERRVTAMYNTYLGRGTDPTGLSTWTWVILGQGDNAVRASILGSQEYKNRSIQRFS